MLKQLKTIQHLIEEKKLNDAKEQCLAIIDFTKETTELKNLHQLISQNPQAALLAIKKQIQKSNTLQESNSVPISGLKTSISLLEVEFSVLNHKKAQLNKQINDFRIRHNKEVGMLIGEILKLRRELLFNEKDTNPDTHEAYEKANSTYEKYKNHQAHFTCNKEKTAQLSTEEKKQLQELFRNASKLCHPDLIADELKEHATELFMELNNAYFAGNLERMNEIYTFLQDKNMAAFSKSKKITERDKLEILEEQLNSRIYQLKAEIKEIESSDAYKTIKNIVCIDQFFIDLKEKLNLQRKELKAKL